MFHLSLGTAINFWAEKVGFLGKENRSMLVSALFEINSKKEPVRGFMIKQLFIRKLHCGKILC